MLVRFERAPRLRSAVSDIFDFERNLDGLFRDFLGSRSVPFTMEYPAISVRDRGKEFELLAEVPGLGRDEIKISVQEGVLTLSGERKAAELPEKSRWIRNEIPRGSFSRSVRLPREVDPTGVNAELKDGILRLVLPKSQESLPREIAVR